MALFDVPESLQNLEFTLTALAGQRYRFGGGAGVPAFDAVVGQHYRLPTSEGDIELRVAAWPATRGRSSG